MSDSQIAKLYALRARFGAEALAAGLRRDLDGENAAADREARADDRLICEPATSLDDILTKARLAAHYAEPESMEGMAIVSLIADLERLAAQGAL